MLNCLGCIAYRITMNQTSPSSHARISCVSDVSLTIYIKLFLLDLIKQYVSFGDSIFWSISILCCFLKSILRLAYKKAAKYIIDDKTLTAISTPCFLYRKSTMSNKEHAPVFPQLPLHKRQQVSIIRP